MFFFFLNIKIIIASYIIFVLYKRKTAPFQSKFICFFDENKIDTAVFSDS